MVRARTLNLAICRGQMNYSEKKYCLQIEGINLRVELKKPYPPSHNRYKLSIITTFSFLLYHIIVTTLHNSPKFWTTSCYLSVSLLISLKFSCFGAQYVFYTWSWENLLSFRVFDRDWWRWKSLGTGKGEYRG